MYKTILIIDDDIRLLKTLAENLQSDYIKVLTATDTVLADKVLQIISPDVIVLDRMMPNEDGLSYLTRLRNSNCNIPVLMLTALNDSDNIVSGLKNGANDYLGKPFNFKELQLRIQNLLNLNINNQSDNFVKIEFDEVFINGEAIKLSETEFKLFKELFIHKFQSIKLCDLSDNLNLNMQNIPVLIKRLRNKINSVTNRLEIQSIYKSGYKLIIRN